MLERSKVNCGKNERQTNPTARDEWANSPSKESVGSLDLRCNKNKAIETPPQTRNTIIVKFNSNKSANTMPNKDACASVSPKKAIRRQIIRHPNGPAINATPIPATNALIKKSSNIQLIPVLLNLAAKYCTNMTFSYSFQRIISE